MIIVNMQKLEKVKNNPLVLEFIKRSKEVLKAQSFTDHGLEHSELVSARASELARKIGFSQREQELSAIAGLVHDFGNFLDRRYHDSLGALLFQNIFQRDFDPVELSLIMEAIASHDDFEKEFASPISAVLTLADKSDVRRSRVLVKDKEEIKGDVHDRVNYAATSNYLKINKERKLITLILTIDTSFVPVMEYFEIFTQRMVQCRKAAKFLGYKFGLIINKFKLL